MFHPKGPSLRELLVQGFSSLEHGYDLLAPKFDYTPFRTPDEVLQAVTEQIGPAERHLDLCCGTGAGLKASRAREQVGVDLSAGMLAQAKPATLVRGDVLHLPLRDSSFDLATCFGALGHIEEERTFIHEVARVLRPGGRFVFVTSHRLKATDPARWIAQGFNLGWRVRNALFKPKFVMYYLTFLVEDVTPLLEAAGFRVEVKPTMEKYKRLVTLTATKLS